MTYPIRLSPLRGAAALPGAARTAGDGLVALGVGALAGGRRTARASGSLLGLAAVVAAGYAAEHEMLTGVLPGVLGGRP